MEVKLNEIENNHGYRLYSYRGFGCRALYHRNVRSFPGSMCWILLEKLWWISITTSTSPDTHSCCSLYGWLYIWLAAIVCKRREGRVALPSLDFKHQRRKDVKICINGSFGVEPGILRRVETR